jgi:general secretion pathway protein E
LRVDGTLQTVETVPQNLEPAVIARLKLIANMNIAENRLPQDGRIGVRIAGQEMDIRASSVPTQFGESFVVRLLGREAIDYAVENLGLYPDHCEGIRRIVRHPNGIFLTTGPTGSGKTTTLYSMLTEVSTDENKVVTVENPVEYELPSANQINIRPEIDYTFSNALRSILRQDPDIIMVGEIRDLETAEIAVQASLTGHLVLSTLHTNSALDAIPRLLDMGMEFYLLKACICGLMAQRLVRKLCSHCRVMAGIPPEAERLYGLDALAGRYPFVPVAPQTAPGCERCSGNGYRGRVVIAEVLPCDAKTLERIGDQGGADLHELGTRTMFEDGLLKMLEGRTTLEDVLRASR